LRILILAFAIFLFSFLSAYPKECPKKDDSSLKGYSYWKGFTIAGKILSGDLYKANLDYYLELCSIVGDSDLCLAGYYDGMKDKRVCFKMFVTI